MKYADLISSASIFSLFSIASSSATLTVSLLTTPDQNSVFSGPIVMGLLSTNLVHFCALNFTTKVHINGTN